MSQKQSQWILAEIPGVPPDVDSGLPEILVRMMLQGVAILPLKGLKLIKASPPELEAN